MWNPVIYCTMFFFSWAMLNVSLHFILYTKWYYGFSFITHEKQTSGERGEREHAYTLKMLVWFIRRWDEMEKQRGDVVKPKMKSKQLMSRQTNRKKLMKLQASRRERESVCFCVCVKMGKEHKYGAN